MRYYDELTPEQQSKVLDKMDNLDLPIFMQAREAAHTLMSTCRLYIFDDSLTMYIAPIPEPTLD